MSRNFATTYNVIRKEFGSLKGAITWAIRIKWLPLSPINNWPQIKIRRLKRFEWKCDIDRRIGTHKREMLKSRQGRQLYSFPTEPSCQPAIRQKIRVRATPGVFGRLPGGRLG